MKLNNSITPDELDKIERFLINNMDEAESSEFVRRLETDGDLKQKTDEIRLLLLGIREASLEDELERVIPKVPVVKQSGRLVTIHWKKWMVAASVLVLAVLGVVFLVRNKDADDSLYTSYYQPDPGLATVMSTRSDYQFEKAMVEYKDGEYEKARLSWTALLDQKPGNDTLIYFIASASQAQGDHAAAMENFQRIIKDSASSFYKDACWYMGLLYLKKDEHELAAQYIKISGYPAAQEIIKAITKP